MTKSNAKPRRGRPGVAGALPAEATPRTIRMSEDERRAVLATLACLRKPASARNRREKLFLEILGEFV